MMLEAGTSWLVCRKVISYHSFSVAMMLVFVVVVVGGCGVVSSVHRRDRRQSDGLSQRVAASRRSRRCSRPGEEKESANRLYTTDD